MDAEGDINITAGPIRGGQGFEGPPPPIMNIDFSMLHMLDHNILHCHGPGGRRHHARIRWEFHGKPWIKAHTRCKIGLHERAPLFRMVGQEAVAARERCVHCDKRFGDWQAV